MSIEEENKAIIGRIIGETFNKGDLSVADDVIADNYVFHGTEFELRGVEGFKQIITMLRAAFPDFHATIEDMVGEGNTVACRFVGRGTFKGEYRGIAPTGKEVTFAEASFIYFEDGKEVEVWSYMDNLSFHQQLGVTPPLGK